MKSFAALVVLFAATIGAAPIDVPTAPKVPTAPTVPTVPTVPEVPTVPTVPTPTLPEAPAGPIIPAIPVIPTIPTISLTPSPLSEHADEILQHMPTNKVECDLLKAVLDAKCFLPVTGSASRVAEYHHWCDPFNNPIPIPTIPGQ
ncbi:hypothetical protein BGZ82_008983 [Podila clonocystis]|nr:hypothetical protein BGZ82_008983 [Podila clonocystis]